MTSLALPFTSSLVLPTKGIVEGTSSMAWDRRTWTLCGALSGLIGVAAGALGAHATGAGQEREWLRTGATYEMIHALAVVACSALVATGLARARWAAWLFLIGTVLFSGSLYAMAGGAPHRLGAITPVGGLCFLAGWLELAWAATAIRGDRSSD